MEYVTESPTETKKLGKELAEEILKSKRKPVIIGLVGELGGGKTTFLQGFAKGLGVEEKILSPTFVILKRFKIKDRNQKFKNFYHIDCYRIEDPRELLKLDFQKIISDSRNIVVIEWAEKVKDILPKEVLMIRFEILSEEKRKITLKIPSLFGKIDCVIWKILHKN